MIDRSPFGSTGHQSSRVIFGAAALAAMRDEKTRPLLETLLEFGVNHLDTAEGYGDSELRLAPWLREHKYWPPVGRVDNAYGDRNLMCTCPSVDELSVQ